MERVYSNVSGTVTSVEEDSFTVNSTLGKLHTFKNIKGSNLQAGDIVRRNDCVGFVEEDALHYEAKN